MTQDKLFIHCQFHGILLDPADISKAGKCLICSRTRAKDRYDRQREIVDNARGTTCERCGRSGERLSFHHRNPATKVLPVSDMVGRASDADIRAEIEKCDVLCERCHRLADREVQPERAARLARARAGANARWSKRATTYLV